MTRAKKSRVWNRRVGGLALLAGCLAWTPALGQVTGPKGPSGATKPQNPAPPAAAGSKSGANKTRVDANRKMTDQERRQERAREIFADAANAQNNGAFDVAIELWKKLIREQPDSTWCTSGRFYLGVCYQEQDPPDYPAAIDAFRDALKTAEFKEREEALCNLGWCLYESGAATEPPQNDLLTEASRVLAAFLEKFPDSPHADRALFYAGEAESRLGRTDRAISFYNQLVQGRGWQKSPLRPDAMFALGIAYEQAQQPKLASETYEAFVTAYPKSPFVLDSQVRLAELALQSNQADRAIPLFNKVMEHPQFRELAIADYVYYRHAFALAKAGKFAESAQTYQTLADRFPKSPYATVASLAIGQTLMQDKKYEEASRAFERILPFKDERAAEAAHWLCQIAILQNRPQEAIPIAREAIAWASKWDAKTLSPNAANMIAMLRMDLADGLYSTQEGKAEARKLYERIAVESVELPISPRATYNAAFAAMQAREHAEAQRWSEAFAKRFPNDELSSDVAYIRAESLLQLSQYESASTAFEQLIRSAGEHPSLAAWELRAATAKYLGGAYDDAIVQAEVTLKRGTDDLTLAEAHFLRGASLLKLKRNSDAIEALELSLKTSATWSQADETLFILSQALDASDQKDAAKRSLERLLKEFPNSRFRQQAEFRLGQLSAFAQNFDEALSWYDRVLAKTPEPPLVDFVRYDKAFVLIQINQFAQANEILDQVLASTTNNALTREAKTAKAVCLRRIDQPRQAVKLLEDMLASESTPEHRSKILYEQGLAYSAMDDSENAIRTLEQLATLNPNYSLIDRCFFELAWAHKSIGNLDQANAWFQKITERFPDSPLAAESYFQVGQAEFENARFDSAVKAYTVAATKTASPEIQEKSLYKWGLSLFQQGEYKLATEQFSKQLKAFPNGLLHVDAKLMIAECSLKLENFTAAWPQYEQARKAMETNSNNAALSDQVKALIYLHGAQAARELKRWKDVDSWISAMQTTLPGSNLEAVGKYEQAFAKQNLKENADAIRLYEEVAENQRNELGARARFMMGEVYFADRNFAKAVSEFQKVMYGYGGTQATDDIKNWQARAAFEAGRCTEVFIADLSGERRKKAIDTTAKFYEFILQNHANHELAKQATERMAELKK